jgi:hypothetical protein
MRIPKSRAKTAYGLLSEVRKLILTEPLRYDQNELLVFEDSDNWYGEFPSCGTVGCRAGWVIMLKSIEPKRVFDIWDRAEKILGLTEGQASELFTSLGATGKGQSIEHARSGAQGIVEFQKKYSTQLRAKRV